MTFADVNNEPWHVQPVELPKGRQQYEQQGSKWGAYPSYEPRTKTSEALLQASPAARRPRSAASGALLRRPSPRRWSPDPATPARRHDC